MPSSSRADLREWARTSLEKIDGRRVLLSVSGGKDSTACGLLLMEAGIEFEAIHFDTGWEHELTEDYVRNYLPKVLGREIRILQGRHGGMEDLCRKKGTFPSRVRRLCTKELKVFPFLRYVESLDDEVVNLVGIRAGESLARSKLEEWEEDHPRFPCSIWRPIISWSTQDVIDMHKLHGVQPNPLYLRGAERVGCWPCIYARKSEIRMIADLSPNRIERIRRLESELSDRAGAPRAWFQSRNGVLVNGERRFPPMAIDDVVAWSRTAHGGKQPELFAPPYREIGCMRWGMCDTVSPEQEAEWARRGL